MLRRGIQYLKTEDLSSGERLIFPTNWDKLVTGNGDKQDKGIDWTRILH